MAQRLPSIKRLVEEGLLSTFETGTVLVNGVERLAFLYDEGSTDRLFQGGQYVPNEVIDHLNAVMKHTVSDRVSNVVGSVTAQAVSDSMSGVTFEASYQLSEGLFVLGELLEQAMSPRTYDGIFKQLNVLGEAVLMSTDKNAGRWWVQESGERPGQRYTGKLFGNRNVVTGIHRGKGKGFEWPDIGLLDKEVQHWRVIEFGNRDKRPMPKGYIYPYYPKGAMFTDSKFTFKKPKVADTDTRSAKAQARSSSAASGVLWTGPLGFNVRSDTEPDAKDISARAQRAVGLMVQNRPKHLFATVHKKALAGGKVLDLFEDITQTAYNKAMIEQTGSVDLEQEIQDRIRARINLG